MTKKTSRKKFSKKKRNRPSRRLIQAARVNEEQTSSIPNTGNLGTLEQISEQEKQISKLLKDIKNLPEPEKITPDGDPRLDLAHEYTRYGNAANYVHRDYPLAIKYLKKSLALFRDVLGDYHTVVLINYTDLGNAYQKLGDHRSAIECYQKSLEISTLSDDPDSDRAMYHEYIGKEYRTLGDYQQALKHHKLSLEIHKAAFGDSHLAVSDDHSNLGNVYGDLGQHQTAIEHHLESLAIRKSALGESSSKVASTYIELGTAYANSGDHKRGIECLEQTLATLNPRVKSMQPAIKQAKELLDLFRKRQQK